MSSKLLKMHINFKEKYPDAIVLIRCGNFYETFNDDAQRISETLGIPLLNREEENTTYLVSGFSLYSLDFNLPKLVRAGHRVAICDML